MIDTKEYAKALFLLAQEKNAIEATLSELKLVEAALAEDPEYAPLLDSPALSREEKDALIEQAFASLDVDLRSFLKILCSAHALYTIPRTLAAYEALCDEAMGILRAEAITALPLTEAQSEKICARLKEQTGKTVVLKNTVDASVLGGIKLRFMGKQMDASLKNRLESIRESLRSTALGVKNNGR